MPLPQDFNYDIKERLGFNPKLEFKVEEDFKDDLGQRHIRTQLLYNEVPLEGALVKFHYGSQGQLLSISGIRPLEINDQGSKKPLKSFLMQGILESADLNENKKTEKSEINILAIEPCYYPILKNNVVVSFNKGYKVFFDFGGSQYSCFYGGDKKITKIKTTSQHCNLPGSVPGGQISTSASYLGVIAPPTNYDLYYNGSQYQPVDLCRNIITHTTATFPPSVPSYSSPNINGAVGLYHWFMGNSYDYFVNNHNYSGFEGIPLHLELDNTTSLVPVYRYENSSNPRHVIEFQSDFGANLTDIDIAGHEFSHLVAHEFSQLYLGTFEASTINESFAHIFGTVLEKEALDAIGQYPTNFNWAMNFHSPTGGNLPVDDPHSGSYADTYGGLYWNSNSREVLLAYGFYLLSEGNALPETNDNGYTYNLNGIGMSKAANIFYRAMRVYMHPFQDFYDARKMVIQSAKDIYGGCSTEYYETIEMFDAIGILDNTHTCPTIVSASVNVNNQCNPNPNAGNISMCSYTRSGPTPTLTYSWTGPNGFTANTANITAPYYGIYHVTVTACGNKTMSFNLKKTEIENQYSTSSTTNSEHVGVDIKSMIPIGSPDQSMTFKTGYYEGGDIQMGGLTAVDNSPSTRDFYLASYLPCGKIAWMVYSDQGDMEPVDLEIDRNPTGQSSAQAVLVVKSLNGSGHFNLWRNYNGAISSQAINYTPGCTSLVLVFDLNGNLVWKYEGFDQSLQQPFLINDLDIDENSTLGNNGSMYYIVGSIDFKGAIQSLLPSGILHTEMINPTTCALAPYQFCHINDMITVKADSEVLFVGGNNQDRNNRSINEISIVSRLRDFGNGISFTIQANNHFYSTIFSELNDIEYSPTHNLLIVAGTFTDDLVENQTGNWGNFYNTPIKGDPDDKNVFFFKLNPTDLSFNKAPVSPIYNYFGTISTDAKTQGLGYTNSMEIINPEIHIDPLLYSQGTTKTFYISGQVNSHGGRIWNTYDYNGCPMNTYDFSSVDVLPSESYFVARYQERNCSDVYGITYNGFPVSTYMKPNTFYAHKSSNLQFGGSDLLEPESKIIIHGGFKNILEIPVSNIYVDAGPNSRCFTTKHDATPNGRGLPSSRMKHNDKERKSSEAILTSDVQVYPNPSTGNVNIDFSETSSGEIMLYDIYGKVLFSGEFSEQSIPKIDLSSFANGVYLLNIKTLRGNSSHRIVKQ
ncbi:MAG: M4 family metallopeptidase [Vicingaceae bacterium]